MSWDIPTRMRSEGSDCADGKAVPCICPSEKCPEGRTWPYPPQTSIYSEDSPVSPRLS